MKRYLRSDSSISSPISLVVEVVFGYSEDNTRVAASKGVVPDSVPKTQLPHVVKGVPLGLQAKADYDSFVTSVVELMEDYYDLHIYYKNTSPDESHYYACLAKDASKELVLDFKVKIRIATHAAHESKQADYNKARETEATKEVAKGKKLKPLYIQLICNDENEDVSTYDEAYLWIDDQLDRKVEIMKRGLKYRKR